MTTIEKTRAPAAANPASESPAAPVQAGPVPQWGAGPDAGYEALAARFRPIFARIAEGAVAREVSRTLPVEEIGWLRQARFGALRVPVAEGGFGATLPQLFGLLTELAAADSNLVQALRAHFGFTEDILAAAPQRRALWLPRIAAGEIAGSAWTETGPATQDRFSTRITGNGGDLRLTGRKFYTTGSLYADWIDVGASDETGAGLSAVVSRHAPGVEVHDDWDGMGQRLTASGTTVFTDVPVTDVVSDETRFSYGAAFYQLVHFATLAGIGRAAATETARQVAARTRNFSHANAALVRHDPQVLAVVGRVTGAAYAAGAIVLKVAEALQAVFEAGGDADALEAAGVRAEIEVASAQGVVIDLILDATSAVFDALGASSTLRANGLDRFWRNARTLANHNPRIYKDRIVGDYAVNGTRPPFQWRIGQA